MTDIGQGHFEEVKRHLDKRKDNGKTGNYIKVLRKWEEQKVKMRDKKDDEEKQTKIPKGKTRIEK